MKTKKKPFLNNYFIFCFFFLYNGIKPNYNKKKKGKKEKNRNKIKQKWRLRLRIMQNKQAFDVCLNIFELKQPKYTTF